MCLKVLFKKNKYNTYKKHVTVHMTSRIRNASHIEKFNTTSFNIIKHFQIRSIKFKEKNVSEYIKKHTKSLCYVTNPSRNIPNSGFTEMSIKKYTEFGFHRNVYQETYSNPSRSILLRYWVKYCVIYRSRDHNRDHLFLFFATSDKPILAC